MASRVSSATEAQHRKRPGLRLKQEVAGDTSQINFYTGTASEILVGDYLVGPRAYVVSKSGSTTITFTVSRRGGANFTIAYPSSQQLQFGRIG